MKIPLPSTLIAIVAWAFALSTQAADPVRFSLESVRIDINGGGAARGGRFEIVASISPTAAESSGNHRYQMDAAFILPITVIQVPDAPELRILLLGDGNIRLTWDAESTGFILQGRTDATSGGWEAHPTKPSELDGQHVVVLGADQPHRMFRLSR
jgi:hypothetical protein